MKKYIFILSLFFAVCIYSQAQSIKTSYIKVGKELIEERENTFILDTLNNRIIMESDYGKRRYLPIIDIETKKVDSLTVYLYHCQQLKNYDVFIRVIIPDSNEDAVIIENSIINGRKMGEIAYYTKIYKKEDE